VINAKAGEAIQAGDVLYIASAGIVRKADATNPLKATVVGIAANDAALGQNVKVIISGKAKGLQSLEVGKRYYLGANAALTTIVPEDAVKTVPVGIAFSETELIMQLTQDLTRAQ
jgi:hypothetical protein